VYVQQKAQSPLTGGGVGDTVREKFLADDADGAKDQKSRMEGYRTPQRTASGKLAAYAHHTKNPASLIELIFTDNPDPEVFQNRMNMYELFRNTLQPLSSVPVTDVQKTLVKLVVHEVIPAETFSFINKGQLLNTIAAAQVWLWENKFYMLAALIGSSVCSGDETLITGSEARTRLNKATAEILNLEFPFSMTVNKRDKTQPSNPAIIAIDKISTDVGACDWMMNLPRDMCMTARSQAGLQVIHTNILPCPENIRNIVASLFVHISRGGQSNGL
jgi:hypothetical protein